jgi:Lhr-like helicase
VHPLDVLIRDIILPVASAAGFVRRGRSLQTVVVDEVHAFAGDDRGWHLRTVLERLRSRPGAFAATTSVRSTVG